MIERTRVRPTERGFTLMEVLVALVVLLIGIAGLLSMQMSSLRATGYSRHVTEASILAEDKMEELRTVPATTLPIAPGFGTETVDGQGTIDTAGFFTRTWSITWDPDPTVTVGYLSVVVSWNERGTEAHSVSLATQRAP